LYVEVAGNGKSGASDGAGGFNGGGSSTGGGGGGGGASDLRGSPRVAGLSPDPRLIVAGGGGGGGGGVNGGQGGSVDSAGGAASGSGGGAGTSSAGGTQGFPDGQVGGLGFGGGGLGGGGGSGYYGGGGGGDSTGRGAGGGGGSSLVPVGGSKVVAEASASPQVQIAYLLPGEGSSGGGSTGGGATFGAKTLVTLNLAVKRIPARGPLKVRVANANGFAITGKLLGQTTKKVSISRKRRIKLQAARFTVAPHTKKTVKLKLPKALRNVLKRKHKLALRLNAKVKDPAGDTRTVEKTVKPKLKKTSRRRR
jgi:hypothetical protein